MAEEPQKMPIPRRTPLIAEMRVEAKHVAELNKILAASVKEIDAEIAAMGKAGANPITIMQAKAQREAMNDFMSQTFDNLEDVTRRGMDDAAVAASRVVSRYENTLLKAVLDKKTMNSIASSEAQRAARGMEAALRRMQGASYKPLSKAVYDTRQLASGWVDNTINRALASGWSRARLAKELQKSIDPRVPGGVSYAANRTARTEINNSFHASSADRYMNSVIVEGVDWNLSSSHPEGDICDTLADESPYPKKGVPQKPHPNCYCFITPALPTEDEFIDKLFNGDYDDENWAEQAKEVGGTIKFGPVPQNRPHVSVDTAPEWARSKLGREWRFYNGMQQTDTMWAYDYDGMKAIRGAADNLRNGKAIDEGLDLDRLIKKAGNDFYEDGVQVLTAAQVRESLELAARDFLSRIAEDLPESVYRGMYVPMSTSFKVGDSVDMNFSSWTSTNSVAEVYTQKQAAVHKFEEKGYAVVMELRNAKGFRIHPSEDWDEMLVNGSVKITSVSKKDRYGIVRLVAEHVR